MKDGADATVPHNMAGFYAQKSGTKTTVAFHS